MASLTTFTLMMPYHLFLFVVSPPVEAFLLANQSNDRIAFLSGTQIYQSTLANNVAFRALLPSHFRALQGAIWPMYFKLQSVLAVMLALTYPGFVQHSTGNPSLLHKTELLRGLLPISAIFAFAVMNSAVIGPMTIRLMHRKVFLETSGTKDIPENFGLLDELRIIHTKFEIAHKASLVQYGYPQGDIL
ncbi:MAG: hypothetical protein Q9164_006910, partial [Protoblastenia rupestris]